MRLIYAAVLLLFLSGCYTEIQKRERTPEGEVPVYDTTVFLPDISHSLAGFYIEDLYGRWKNSFEEQTNLIKVYRRDNEWGFPPARFRDEIIFDKSGKCWHLILLKGDMQEYLKYRWRLLKEDPNIICLFNKNGRRERSLRIESLEPGRLSLVWLK